MLPSIYRCPRSADLFTYWHVLLCVFVTGRHQNLQAELSRLSDREIAMQTEQQRLQQTIVLLEKVFWFH